MKPPSRAAPPEFIAPQLATLVERAPAGEQWIFEYKFDGYRLLARKHGQSIALWTRNRLNWAERYPEIVSALKRFRSSFIMDGELVALHSGAHELGSFQALQGYGSAPHGAELRYYVFDLLWAGGTDLTSLPLTARKKKLHELVFKGQENVGPLWYSHDWEEDGNELLKRVCSVGGEGIICKDKNGRYLSRRTPQWQKVKCTGNDEFIIGGFTPFKNYQGLIGALLLGKYENRRLHYVGKVGTGFSERKREELYLRLKGDTIKESPFVNRVENARNAQWVKPKLFAQISYTEVTSGGKLRHPSFLGLREDKRPKRGSA